MKKALFFLFLSLVFTHLFGQAVNVTFQVDMSNETVNANGVHIAGNFQQAAGFPSNWTPGATQLFDSLSNNIYEITVAIPTGTYEYKFINGNAWGNDESVPAACGIFSGGSYNREVVIGANDTTIPPVFFGTCLASTPPKMVVFQLGMKGQIINSNGVHVAGNFQQVAGFPSNWDPTTTELTDPDGDSIYTDTVMIPAGTIEYKFINGNTWANEETVPSSCGVPNGNGGFNRSLIFTADTTLTEVCFASCAPCISGPTPIYNVTFKVDLKTYTGSYNNVFVSGTFNGWSGTLDTLFDANGDTVFEKTLQLAAGTYEYKFQLDNWTIPELFTGSEPCVTQSPGNVNRIFTVAGDTILGEYCFNSCAACPAAPPIFKEVVFSVDMNDYDTTFNSVFVSGTFNSWCGTCDELFDNDFDGIYSDTILIPANDTVFYKFSIDNWADGENFTAADSFCTDTLGAIYNRVLFVTNDTTLGTPCFNSCNSCPPRPQFTTTLITNMKFQQVDTSGVFVLGTFNNYDSTATTLNNYGDSLYGLTLNLDSGKTIYYRFLNGPIAELTGGNCFSQAPNGMILRSFTPSQNNDTLSFCFNECDTCAATPAQQFHQVTFRVDMFGQSISANGVHVAGDFQAAAGYPNNWDPAGTMMQDLNGDSIYEITVVIPADTFQYKFINGNTWNDDEVVPQTCGVGNGPFNRQVIITGDTTLLDVCFSSCNRCPKAIPPTQYQVTFKVDMRVDTANPSGVYLTGDFVGWQADSLLMSITTPGIYEITIPIDSGVSYQYKFLNGPSFNNEESVPALCGLPNGFGGFNREITALQNTVLDTVCFGECGPCNLASLTQVNVTFKVNMENETVATSGVFLTGDFNNWNLTQLTNSSNDIYEITLPLDSNANYQYKFVNGNAPGVFESVPSNCRTPDGMGGFNRSLIAFGSVALNPVCFGECTNCATPTPQVEVRFRVNMENNPASNFGVHIAGDFNNYMPNQNMMTDANNDSIFEIALMFDQGTSIRFNFYNGVTLANKEKTDSLENCGIDNGVGDYERYLDNIQTDVTLPVVCFERCNECVKENSNIGIAEGLASKVHVALIGDELQIINNGQPLESITIFDISGKVIKQVSLTGKQNVLVNLDDIPQNGVYIYRINNSQGQIQDRFVLLR